MSESILKKIFYTILVIIGIYPLGWYLLINFLLGSDIAFYIYISLTLLSIVWLLGNCWGIIKLRLPSNLKELIYLIKKYQKELLSIVVVIIGIYPLGFYLMSWLLYDLSDSSPLIALIGLIIYPIVYIVVFLYLRIQYGAPISDEDFKAWGSAIQRVSKTCPNCFKKLPSIFTSKCPYCTSELT